jgi:hypothetical protein
MAVSCCCTAAYEEDQNASMSGRVSHDSNPALDSLCDFVMDGILKNPLSQTSALEMKST